jgi:poly(3-hydroxybutyrate) depolymerase
VGGAGFGPTGGTEAGGTQTGGGSGSTAGTSGTGGARPDIDALWPSFGCGKDYAGLVGQKIIIPTSGVKDANCTAQLNGAKKCGAWGQESSTWQKSPLERNYWVYLPANYDPNKAYPLVLEGPGCSGNGGGVFSLPSVKDSVIRIGLSPADRSVGHGTNPDQGCFDDKEGDDSLDFVFYEALYDKLNDSLCFDRNRVFALGESSGGWLANELGCKYAGDSHGRPIRGIVSGGATLPNQPEFAPTCTTQPMAGLWVHKPQLGENSISPRYAVARAMQVNGCTGASDYDDAVNQGLVKDFPIGSGNPDGTCKQLESCPALYPLVVCEAPGGFQSGFGSALEPAASVFIKSLMAR